MLPWQRHSASLYSHLTHDSLGPSKPTTQTASQSVQPSHFCTDDRRVSLYFTTGRSFPPQNCPFSMGGSGLLSNAWFPGPTQVLNPNGISIGSAIFAGLTTVTDRRTDSRPTDHATRLVTIGRIYVSSTAMRPNNIRLLYCFTMQKAD